MPSSVEVAAVRALYVWSPPEQKPCRLAGEQTQPMEASSDPRERVDQLAHGLGPETRLRTSGRLMVTFAMPVSECS